MEGACYGKMDQLWDKYHPRIFVDLPDYWIDRTEVTNDSYRTFLEQTRYLPRDLTNFLRHWKRPDGSDHEPWTWSPPADKASHPVIWVDLDDARAYARWAGKRLPIEEEWHKAAGHSVWPWGDGFDPSLCNSGSEDTMPVDQFPRWGQSRWMPGHGRQRLGVDRERTWTTATRAMPSSGVAAT